MGHPRSGSKRGPEWASSQAPPGEQKEGPAGMPGGWSLDLPCGTFPGLWNGGVEDLTPSIPGSSETLQTAAAPVPIAAEKQSWPESETSRNGWRRRRMGWDSVVWARLGTARGSRGGRS